jgi:hypothetical protein
VTFAKLAQIIADGGGLVHEDKDGVIQGVVAWDEANRLVMYETGEVRFMSPNNRRRLREDVVSEVPVPLRRATLRQRVRQPTTRVGGFTHPGAEGRIALTRFSPEGDTRN